MAGSHISTQFTGHGDTVFFRHHHVADNNIRQKLQRLIQPLHTIGSLYNAILGSEDAAQENTQFGIIFYQQHQIFGCISTAFFLRTRFRL